MLPDNRLRFNATRIDFANDVGETGQPHEQFPAPDSQPRFDWLLMWFLALFANQASFDTPNEYRSGTIWYDLNTQVLKIWNGSEWALLSDAISISTGDDATDVISLQDWFTGIAPSLLTAAPEITFSGISDTDGVASINVPPSLTDNIDEINSRPFIYKNGLLIDPRNCEFFTTATIQLLNGIVLDTDDAFTVVVKNITPQLFHIPTVRIP